MTSAQLSTPIDASHLEPAPSAGPEIPAHLRRIVLTGFMGAGKSTIGRLLAEQLNWNFLDLDAHLESRAGATIPEIFATHGEAHFRQMESSALASALGRSSTVLALGGGTPEVLTNRLLLEQTPGTATIFLDAPFETLFDRCVLQGLDRPVLADADLARSRFLSRLPLYRRLSRVTLQTEALNSEETVALLLNSLKKITAGRR